MKINQELKSETTSVTILMLPMQETRPGNMDSHQAPPTAPLKQEAKLGPMLYC